MVYPLLLSLTEENSLYNGFQEYATFLEKRGLLRRIGVSVSGELEIAAIAQRACRLPEGGPALLFEKISGSEFPIMLNSYGSAERLTWAFSVGKLSQLTERVVELFKPVCRRAWEYVSFSLEKVQSLINIVPDKSSRLFAKKSARFITPPLASCRFYAGMPRTPVYRSDVLVCFTSTPPLASKKWHLRGC